MRSASGSPARRALLDRREHRLDLVRYRGSWATAAAAPAAAAPATDRRRAAPRRAGSRRSAAAPPTAAPRSTAQAPPQRSPSRAKLASTAPARATRVARPPPPGRCDRRAAYCAPRPLPPPSCREAVDQRAVALGHVTSAPAPRRRSSAPDTSCPVRRKRIDRMEHVERAEPRRIAGACSRARGQQHRRPGLPPHRRAVDQPGPARLRARARADSAVEPPGDLRVDPAKPGEPGDQQRACAACPRYVSRSAKSSIRASVDPQRRRRRARRAPASPRPRRPARRPCRSTSARPARRLAVDSRRRTATRSGSAHPILQVGARARPAPRARAVSDPRRHRGRAVDCALPHSSRIADSRASRSLPTKARRSCHGIGPAKLVGVGAVIGRRIKVDQRVGRQHAQRRRGPRRRQSSAVAENIGARASQAANLRLGALISRSGGIIAVAVDKAVAPAVELVDRLPFDRHRARRYRRRRRPPCRPARGRSPPTRPRRRAGSMSAAARSDSPASEAQIAVDQRRDPRLDLGKPGFDRAQRRRVAVGQRRPAAATWTILGVKRSVSTLATSSRAASASPSRSSSQARSATQSAGWTSAGAGGLREQRVAQPDLRPARRERRRRCGAAGPTGTCRCRAPRPRAEAERRRVAASRPAPGRGGGRRDIRPAAAARLGAARRRARAGR